MTNVLKHLLSKPKDVAQTTAKLALDKGIDFVEAAAEIWQDITISIEIRDGFGIRGLADAASKVSGLGRTFNSPVPDEKGGRTPLPEPGILVEVTGATLSAARGFLTKAQRANRYGNQVALIEFERVDVQATCREAAAVIAGKQVILKHYKAVDAAMGAERVEVLGDLADETLDSLAGGAW